MAGRKGFVTLRLAQPLMFDAVTISHAPGVESDTRPRHFTVTGYPPCTACPWGFDADKGKVLSVFDFDVSKASQTFEATPDLPQEGSCSEVKPACGPDDAPPSTENVIAGIKIEVTGNWGNADYTCLYRAQLHGFQP